MRVVLLLLYPRRKKNLSMNFFILSTHLNCLTKFQLLTFSVYEQLNGIKRGDIDLTFSLRGKPNREMFPGSDSDESSTPRKIHRGNLYNRFLFGSTFPSDGVLDRFSGSSGSGDETGNQISPGTPPLYNHSNSSRRKGIPHRAPF